MKNPLLLYFFLGLYLISTAQEPINQLDSNGKKHGKWIIYMDARWKQLKDTSQAVYCRYTYYDHGVNIIPIGPGGMRSSARSEAPEGETLKVGHPLLMNGIYKWYDRKGTLRLVHELKNGEMVHYLEYRKNGDLRLEVDHTQRYLEESHSYQLWFTNKKGVRTHYFHQKTDKWGWVDLQAPYEPDSIATEEIKTVGDTIFVREIWYRYGKVDNEVGKIYFKDRGKGFFDGMFHGPYIAWYGNGFKEHEGVYSYGKPLPGWQSWDRDGKPRTKP